jgi:hypothetical protein
MHLLADADSSDSDDRDQPSVELLIAAGSEKEQPPVAVNRGSIKKRQRKRRAENDDLKTRRDLEKAIRAAAREKKREKTNAFVVTSKDGRILCSLCHKPFSQKSNAVAHFRDIHLKQKVFPEPFHCIFQSHEQQSQKNVLYTNNLPAHFKCKSTSNDQKTKEHHLRAKHGIRECPFCHLFFDLKKDENGKSESERHEWEIHGKKKRSHQRTFRFHQQK